MGGAREPNNRREQGLKSCKEEGSLIMGREREPNHGIGKEN